LYSPDRRFHVEQLLHQRALELMNNIITLGKRRLDRRKRALHLAKD
jgi:hypothetical protein